MKLKAIDVDMMLSFLQALVGLLSWKALRSCSLKSIEGRVLSIVVLDEFKLAILVSLIDIGSRGIGRHIVQKSGSHLINLIELLRSAIETVDCVGLLLLINKLAASMIWCSYCR